MTQEIPFPESDAREIANPSIDEPAMSATTKSVLASIGEDPTPVGPDLVSQNESPLEQLMQKPLIADIRAKAQDMLGDLPQKSADVYRRAERTTRENPWIAIAAASAGALAVGFLIGKIMQSKSQAVAYTEEEYPSGYDE